MFSKTLSDKIEPLFYKIQKGKWNLKKYKITNIINSEITIIEGLNNVAIFINSGRDYVDNIVNYPPTAEPMGWASGVNTPSNLGSSS